LNALAAEHLLRVDDRRAVGADSGRLALERVEPPTGPVRKPDVQAWPILAIFDRVLNSEQSRLGLLAVSSNEFSVNLLAVANHHVVHGSIRASAAGPCPIERRPGATESAAPGMLDLQASHALRREGGMC